MNTTYNFEPIENGPEFRAYAAGFATVLQMQLNKGEKLDEQQTAWLAQFGNDPSFTCQLLIEDYRLDQVTAKLRS